MFSFIMGEGPPSVNSRGDTLPQEDPVQAVLDPKGALQRMYMNRLSPAKRAEMFYNWLTGGGAPKKVDPGEIFGQEQSMAPLKQKAAAGMGVGGLFGAGLLIGDLSKPIEPLKPLNQSPMQTGVPYSTTPLIKPPGVRP